MKSTLRIATRKSTLALWQAEHVKTRLMEAHEGLKVELVTFTTKGDRILDLGCSPGSWLLYAAKLSGNKGHVAGIDLKPVTINIPPHVTIYTGDIFSFDSFSESIGKEFNVVISDVAPSTTGIKNVDSARSFNLCQAALEIAQNVLLPGGSFACKIFQGEDFKQFSDSVKSCFATCNIFKPKSSRKASKEIYIIAKRKKTAL